MTAGTPGSGEAEDPENRAALFSAYYHSREHRRLRALLRGRGLTVEEADDLLHEAMLAAWQWRASVVDARHLANLLRKVALDRLVDRIRSAEGRLAFLCPELPEYALPAAPAAEDVVVRADTVRSAWAAIRQLPADDRRLLLDAVRYDYETLARRHDVSAATLRVRVFRLREQLRERAEAPGISVAGLMALWRSCRRSVRKLAEPAALSSRAVVTTLVLTIGAPLLTQPVISLPIGTGPTGTASTGAQLAAAVTALPPGPARSGPSATSPAGTTAEDDSPSRPGKDCVAGGLLCVGEEDGTGGSNPREAGWKGDRICSPALPRCVGQEAVGLCPWLDPMPDEVVRCERVTEPIVDPTPPPAEPL